MKLACQRKSIPFLWRCKMCKSGFVAEDSVVTRVSLVDLGHVNAREAGMAKQQDHGNLQVKT